MTPADLTVAVFRFALNSVLAALPVDTSRDIDDLTNEREAAAAMFTALAPRDAIQAALAARAVTAHHAAMESFRRAALPDVPDTLMTRLFASGMALSRMSMQLINTLEQRQGMAHKGQSVDPIDAILAAAGEAAPTQPPPAVGNIPCPAKTMSTEARATEARAAATAQRPQHPQPRQNASVAPPAANRPPQIAAAASVGMAAVDAELAAMAGLIDRLIAAA